MLDSSTLFSILYYLYNFLFCLMIRRPPRSTRTDTSFPTRRSSDLRRRNLRRPCRRDLPETPHPPRRARNLRLPLLPRRRRRRAGPDLDRLDIVRTESRTLRRQYRYPVPPVGRTRNQRHRALLALQRRQFQPELYRLGRTGARRWRHDPHVGNQKSGVKGKRVAMRVDIWGG